MARIKGPRKIHRYSAEFKLKAVKLSQIEGVQVQDVADAVVPNLAMGYSRPRPGEAPRNNIYTRPARGSFAGGGYSTAEDMLRFSLVLQGGTFLKPETVRAVFGESGPAAPGKGLLSGRVGRGWAGGAPGINTALEVDSKAGTTVVVLANLDPPAATRVARKIRSWLRPNAR